MTILPRDSVWHAITDRFWDAGSLVLARANDRIPVKLVAIVYRKPPQAIFCREDSGLRKPKDLEGKCDRHDGRCLGSDLIPGFAKAAGIDARTVRWILASIESLPGLLATNKVSCVGQFTPAKRCCSLRTGLANSYASPIQMRD